MAKRPKPGRDRVGALAQRDPAARHTDDLTAPVWVCRAFNCPVCTAHAASGSGPVVPMVAPRQPRTRPSPPSPPPRSSRDRRGGCRGSAAASPHSGHTFGPDPSRLYPHAGRARHLCPPTGSYRNKLSQNWGTRHGLIRRFQLQCVTKGSRLVFRVGPNQPSGDKPCDTLDSCWARRC